VHKAFQADHLRVICAVSAREFLESAMFHKMCRVVPCPHADGCIRSKLSLSLLTRPHTHSIAIADGNR